LIKERRPLGYVTGDRAVLWENMQLQLSVVFVLSGVWSAISSSGLGCSAVAMTAVAAMESPAL